MSDKNRIGGTLSECRFHLASVGILSAPLHLDKTFDYLVISPLEVKRGDLVAVPFGGGNRPETALVFNVYPMEDVGYEHQYKPVSRVLNRAFSLSDEAVALVELLKERTFCTTGEAVRCITPSAAFSKLEEYVREGR